MSEGAALCQAVRFAPLVHFRETEQHFPSSTDAFRRISRFRESRSGRSDRGWERGMGWRDSHSHEAGFYDIGWPTITGESLGRYDAGPYRPNPTATLRPRDSLLSGADGLFLQRRSASLKDWSGCTPSGGTVAAPLWIDVAHLATLDPPLVRLLYWFFYELNWRRGMYTHQGDWEHVTDTKAAYNRQARRAWALSAGRRGAGL